MRQPRHAADAEASADVDAGAHADTSPGADADALGDIPAEEEAVLARVKDSLARRRAGARPAGVGAQYDQELMALRDEIGEARREDVPALIAQMERLQGISLRRAEAQAVLVDPGSPYFGHLRLREENDDGPPREKDVMIGRATFVDPERRVNIVDWRHAPISELYYRYGEGSDYEARFGHREVEGEILVRRTVTIEEGQLHRIDGPQGTWRRAEEAGGARGANSAGVGWIRTAAPHMELSGGEGTATRPGAPSGPGPRIRKESRAQRLDRHLPEIAALIDPRQWELIRAPQTGVVVVQGGAGSGKTTIGLHRMAYLAYADPARFAPHRMLVVTYGSALTAYIGQVLPALGITGVQAVTFEDWVAHRLRAEMPWLEARIVDDAPASLLRVKSHPALLHELERRAAERCKSREPARGRARRRAAVDLWAELCTDRPLLFELCTGGGGPRLSRQDVEEAHRFMVERVSAVLDRENRPKRSRRNRGGDSAGPRPTAQNELVDDWDVPHPHRLGRETVVPDDEDIRGETGIDGQRTEAAETVFDLLDAALVLRAHQIICGTRSKLSHLFVDEAQDLAPVELAALLGETGAARSVTLAGDTAQRLFLDNGFLDWRTVLGQLGLDHVAIEPLRISYRSTREILALARHVMGPLAAAIEPPLCPRSGAPVQAHRFPGTGAAVAFLAETLRALFQQEPRATVAVLARHPTEADRIFDGLCRSDVPALRRVRAQDFAFRPGVEVTDIRQVKGLEFDYVVIVDANAGSFGTDDESRHLFHIAATRAAHQLWVLVTGRPSPLLPPQILEG